MIEDTGFCEDEVFAGDVYDSVLSVSSALCNHALTAALSPSTRRALARPKPMAVLIVVPSPAWASPIATAMKEIFPWDRVIVRQEAKRSYGSDHENLDVARSLASGGRVLGVSHAPERLLPPSLVSACDHRLAISGASNSVIRRTIRDTIGIAPRGMPAGIATGLDFPEIVASIRKGETAGRAVRRLRKCAEAKSSTDPSLSEVPSIRELHGYGEARLWAERLLVDLDAWRRGELPFEAIEARAIFASEPGLGKTTLVRSLAKDARLPLIATSVAAWFGTTPGYLDSVIKAIDACFDEAANAAPAILFLDELDALPSRVSLSGRNRDFWMPVITHLLLLLDGAASGKAKNLIILAATNYPDQVDPALVRPGRLASIITIHRPDATALAGIIRQHLGDELPGLDLVPIARLGTGATGADAAGWVKSARQRARASKRPMLIADLLAQVAPEDDRTPGELWACAIHEAAHAVAIHVLSAGKVASVTVAAKEGSGGQTSALFEAVAGITRADVERQVVVGLSGRAAEEEFLGAPTTGAGGAPTSDLGRVTALIASVHGSMGLGESLVFRGMGADLMQALSFDGSLRQTIDADLTRLYGDALALVRSHRGAVIKVARALVAERHIDGARLTSLLAEDVAPGWTQHVAKVHRTEDGLANTVSPTLEQTPR